MLKIQLKPGLVGYFEPVSNTYLTIDKNICTIPDGANISVLKKVHKEPICTFIVIEGSLDDENEDKAKADSEPVKADVEIDVEIAKKEVKAKTSKPKIQTNEDAPKTKRTRKKKEE